MKAITQRESVVTYIKSCLIFQIPRFMLMSKYRVISPLIYLTSQLKFKNSFKLCKISTFSCVFLTSVHLYISQLQKYLLITYKFGLVWPKNINNISNESYRHSLVE